MNDLYGIEPGAYRTPKEWSMQLASFGPHTGRYILCLPGYSVWHDAVLSHLSDMGDLERERIKAVLLKAVKASGFIDRPSDHWRGSEGWLLNALAHWRSADARHKAIFVHEIQYEEVAKKMPDDLRFLASADDYLQISPADREIETEPVNYWDAARLLCSISAHIHFIDPYLDPSRKEDVRIVFVNFVEKISALKKVTEVHFWVRDDSQGDFERRAANKKIEEIMRRAAEGKKKGLKLFFNWVSDRQSAGKMHARYLLTEKGGIKFDQGFQRIRPKGGKNVISPVGADLHRNLQDKYFGKNYEFDVVDTIKVVF